MKKEIDDVLFVQNHQMNKMKKSLGDMQQVTQEIKEIQKRNNDNIDELLKQTDIEFNDLGIPLEELDSSAIDPFILELSQEEIENIENSSLDPFQCDVVELENNTDNTAYFENIREYGKQNNIDFNQSIYDKLLTPFQRDDIRQKINEDYSSKKANCDKYDYMIAAICGTISGLIDVFFVGLPGEGKLSKFTDNQVDGLVEKFAKANGWKGSNKGNPTKSAIGWLENKYKINYDHRHGGDVGGLFKMSPKNHHLKSLSHSPSPIGLFFSIINQFTNTASFISDGKLIKIATENFELFGSNFIAKLFCGFMNWLGHIMSDIAGSSGSIGRGSGIPIPFYELFQFCDFGSFGQHKQTLAQIAVQVFEQGYDFRHGLTMSIPVVINEILVRIMWVIKCKFYHKKSWRESMPSGKIPELRRMLLVSYGTFCAIDLTDAAVRSGGEIISIFLRSNLIAWIRLGHLGYKDLRAYYSSKRLNVDEMDEDFELELKAIYNSL